MTEMIGLETKALDFAFALFPQATLDTPPVLSVFIESESQSVSQLMLMGLGY